MARNYGDIPCANIGGEIHITRSGTLCLCGIAWKCGFHNTDRVQKSTNVIWRELDVVTCDKCRALYSQN